MLFLFTFIVWIISAYTLVIFLVLVLDNIFLSFGISSDFLLNYGYLIKDLKLCSLPQKKVQPSHY